MYEIATRRAACEIGNRNRSVVRLFELLTVLIAALTFLYLALARLDSSFAPFLFALMVVSVLLHRAISPTAGMWAVFLMKDSAYGRVAESGIDYGTLFGGGVIGWSQIDQVDYCPYTGRITIFIRDRLLPVQFGPNKHTALGTQEPMLVNFLRKQVETFGGTFVHQR